MSTAQRFFLAQARAMFESFLQSLPASRCEMVNALDIPDHALMTPYYCSDPDDLVMASESLDYSGFEDMAVEPEDVVDSESSLALSRAVTDSDIDYEWCRRLKNRRFSETWDEMQHALNKFPPSYLDSLKNYQMLPAEINVESLEPSYTKYRWFEEERGRMELFFGNECNVFAPDDPDLLVLEEALESLDLKTLYSDLEREEEIFYK